MNTLIAYASKNGCTQSCAEKLAKRLEGKVELHDLKSGKAVNLSDYDKVIVGGSVYVGKVQKEASDFCTQNMEALKNKKLGLFICGMQSEENLAMELNAAYPQELMANAVARECFGGEFIMKKLGFMEKAIVKVVAKTNQDTSNIREDIIEGFAKAMNMA